MQLRGGWTCHDPVQRYEKHSLVGNELMKLPASVRDTIVGGETAAAQSVAAFLRAAFCHARPGVRSVAFVLDGFGAKIAGALPSCGAAVVGFSGHEVRALMCSPPSWMEVRGWISGGLVNAVVVTGCSLLPVLGWLQLAQARGIAALHAAHVGDDVWEGTFRCLVDLCTFGCAARGRTIFSLSHVRRPAELQHKDCTHCGPGVRQLRRNVQNWPVPLRRNVARIFMEGAANKIVARLAKIVQA